MLANVTDFYAGGNTARGFVGHYDSALQGISSIYLLKNGLGAGKSDFLRFIGHQFAKRGTPIWFLHSASVSGGLDGVIIPEAQIAIIDQSGPQRIDIGQTDAKVRTIDFGIACEASALRIQQPIIERLRQRVQETYELAYAGFAEALRVHDDWESIFITNMNVHAANALTEELVERLFGGLCEARQARVDHRFLGAATPLGPIDFVPGLTAGLKRYLIKGRPGSGKSTLLKRLAREATDRGYDVEIYHCGFEPNSLDMVIVRSLGFAIFDSTAPHAYNPERQSDEIIDMYAACIAPATDETYADIIQELQDSYSTLMKQSTDHLIQAKNHYDDLVQIYARATDFIAIDLLKKELEREVLRDATRFV